MNDNYDNPDAIDPCLGEKSLLEEIQELFDNEVEHIGLKKVCTSCSKPGVPVFMDEFIGTMAELYDDPEEDNEYVRTWAQCAVCRRVICVG
ncbi:MAG: hypothetical protein ACYC0V_00205 [Armatimonadota bacterium]